MSRFALKRHLLASTSGGSGGGGGTPVGNNILLGFNIQGTNYYSPNLIDTDLSHTANDADSGVFDTSNVEIPASNLNSQGQVVTLPSGDTAWGAFFNSPEHSGNVNVSWSPASSVSAVTGGIRCTVVSSNIAAGTAVVTPSQTMSSLQGWILYFTPTGTPMTSLSAIPVGQSAGLTANFQAQITQMSDVGGTLRNMKRNSVEDNQGFYVYGQAASYVAFPTTGIFTSANRNTLNSPNWSPSTGQIFGQTDQWNGRKSDGEPWEAIIARANSANRAAYYSLPWNCDTSYLQAFADVVCANANSTVYVEIANEVWNLGYRVNAQARAEAFNNLNFMDSATTPGGPTDSSGNRLSLNPAHTPSNLISATYDGLVFVFHDSTTGTDAYINVSGAAERYCEKVIQVSTILKARCATNGKPNAIQIVFAWQNSAASVIATMLDYIPNKNGTPTQDGQATKAHVDWVASAPYFLQGSVPTHCGPDMTVLSEAMKDDIDNVTTIAGDIAAAAVARGLKYMTYEGGDSIYFYPLQVQCASTANSALSGGTAFPTFDGIPTSAGTWVLLKNQTTASQNGVYVVGGTSTAWSLNRLGDFNGAGSGMSTWAELWNANVYVQAGTVNTGKNFILTGIEAGTLDTTAVTVSEAPNSGTGTASTEAYYPSGNTTDTVALQVSRDPIQYSCYMYWLDRLNHKLPSGSIVTKYSNVAGVSGRFGSWGSLEQSTDMEMDAATLKADRPKAAAIRDFIAGHRQLQSLIGGTFAATGSTVGTIVGSYKRRTFGSSFSLTGTAGSALSVVDPTAEIIQLQVADASYFTSATTITGNLVEVDARDPAGSKSTAISCQVIGTAIWSPGLSAPDYSITNSGLTGLLTGNGGTLNLLIANKAATSSDKSFVITIDEDQGHSFVGMCAANVGNTGNQPYVCYTSTGDIRYQTAIIFSGLATFTQGDKVKIEIKSDNVFYCAKWVSGAWQWQNGANPATNTGGYTAVGMDNTYLPCVGEVGQGSQVTLDPTGWA